MTLISSSTGASGLLPPEYGELVVRPVRDGSIALRPEVTKLVRTHAHDFHVPIIDEDVAAAWVAEGAEITPDDPGLAELVVSPAKVAGLAIVSREMATDSTPAAQEMVGQSIARSIAAQVDTAFFASTTTNGPGGIAGVLDVNSIVDAGVYGDLDAFAQAQADIEQNGGTCTAFVTTPAVALTLSTLKDQTGSNRPLLGIDATNGTARQILGVPLLVSPKIATGVTWALDATSIVSVLREDVTVAVSTDAYFSSDRVGVRASMRVGFAFTTPGRIAKIATA